MTPLKGANGQVYAMAQGNLLVGGAGAQAGGSSVQVNQLNGGIISNGAIIERAVPTIYARDGIVNLELNTTDFGTRSEEHTSELQSLMRISYAVFCLKKKKKKTT